MPYQAINVAGLFVNRANDRHGELANETAAISQLFHMREAHMKKLATDIVSEGQIYDPPLVSVDGDGYIVFDGNRRLTCFKLILNPNLAPSQELQTFFQRLHDSWQGELPTEVVCQIENDRDRIDAILFRRHTRSQGGVGQSTWDDRAKRNFIDRTGRGGRLDVADEVERLLQEEDLLPETNIPRSTLNRLLSSEANRSRVGISVQGNQFQITHRREIVLRALGRIASDLAGRQIVLGDLWDNHGKRTYLNQLENAGLLPRDEDILPVGRQQQRAARNRLSQSRSQAAIPQQTFIPHDAPQIAWAREQQRARAIWEELQTLELARYPNAVSALMRILLELGVEDYISEHDLRDGEGLAQKFRIVADHLLERGFLDEEYRNELERLRQHEELISIRSMQRFVHSATFAPMRTELIAYWMRLNRFLISCLGR